MDLFRRTPTDFPECNTSGLGKPRTSLRNLRTGCWSECLRRLGAIADTDGKPVNNTTGDCGRVNSRSRGLLPTPVQGIMKCAIGMRLSLWRAAGEFFAGSQPLAPFLSGPRIFNISGEIAAHFAHQGAAQAKTGYGRWVSEIVNRVFCGVDDQARGGARSEPKP